MMIQIGRIGKTIATLSMAFVAAQATAQGYEVVDLGSLGGSINWARDVNEAGQIVGLSRNAAGKIRAFLVDPQDGVWFKDEVDNSTGLAPPDGINDLMIDLGTFGGDHAQAHGINDLGVVTGSAHDIPGNPFHRRGFVLTPENGEYVVLGADGVTNTLMVDVGDLGMSWPIHGLEVNNLGQVVGFSRVGTNIQHGFLWLPAPDYGLPADINDLGAQLLGSFSNANSINDDGLIVGNELNWPYLTDYRAVIWTGSPPVAQDLGTVGGTWASATDINAFGQVAGAAGVIDPVTSEDHVHAFLLTPQNGAWFQDTSPADGANDLMIDLGTLQSIYPDHRESWAMKVNDLGQVVGYSDVEVIGPDILTEHRAFLYDGTSLIDLNSVIPSDSGWILRRAASINNTGLIVGDGLKDGETRAFLLIPPDLCDAVCQIEKLIEMVEELGLPNGLENSLLVKLNHALEKLASGQGNVAINQICAFINEIEAKIPNTISPEDGADLIATAQQAVAQLGGSCP